MQRPSKEMLLEHYSGREPQRFVQIDGWHGGYWKNDSVVATDEHGRSMCLGETYELMHGAHVRILIEPTTAPEEARALLEQAMGWIKEGWLTRYQRKDACLTCGHEELTDDEKPF